MLKALSLMGLLAFGTALIAPATGHEGATGVVKERMQSMKSMARAGKQLARMARGRTPFDPVQAQRLLAELDRHAERIPGYFPDTVHSRRGSDTEAAPDIWSKPAAFEGLARKLSRESRALSAWLQANGEQEFAAWFKAVSDTCRGCHKQFRIKKDR